MHEGSPPTQKEESGDKATVGGSGIEKIEGMVQLPVLWEYVWPVHAATHRAQPAISKQGKAS